MNHRVEERPTPRRRRRRLALVAAVVLITPVAAGAHAALVRSSPPARATLHVAPRRVQLWFGERLEPAYSAVSVWKDGRQVDAGDGAVAVEDSHLLSVGLPVLDGGRYLVKYRVLSVDGHLVEGGYSFTVGDKAARK